VAGSRTERAFELDGLGDQLRFFGKLDQNLTELEALIPVVVRVDGEQLRLSGERDAVAAAQRVLERMLDAARRGAMVTPEDVALAARDVLTRNASSSVPETLVTTNRGTEIRPRTDGQRRYVEAIEANTLTFGIGPAGTGKTFLAVVMAVRALKARTVSRIILSRPAVEAGEKLGFLPGDFKEKVDPYLRPLYDALSELVEAHTVTRYLERGTIEVAPLAFMRGRTLSDAFVVLDEAQNATPEQLKMFLTRIGGGSKMVVCGDVTQIDLPRNQKSGLVEAPQLFGNIAEIGVADLREADAVRHPLIAKIVRAYAEYVPPAP